MKQISKVFVIVGLVLASMALLGGLVCGVLSIVSILMQSYFIFGWMLSWFISGFAAIPLIVVSALALAKWNKITQKNEAILYGVLLLVFGNVIAGILLLCASDGDLAK